MDKQLFLLEEAHRTSPLDERTREIGRRGVAEARRVLAETIQAASRAERRPAA